MDVALYTMTGWNRVVIPDRDLLPLFGAYSVAFWYPHSNTNYRSHFSFLIFVMMVIWEPSL